MLSSLLPPSPRVLLCCAGICSVAAPFALGTNLLFVPMALAILLVILAAFASLNNRLKNLTEYVKTTALQNTFKLSADFAALSTLRDEYAMLRPPVTAASMNPSSLRALQEILASRQPRHIVELGCGISTIFVASWLKRGS